MRSENGIGAFFYSEYLWLGELYEKQNLTLTVNRMILLSQHFEP
jgi:hypothetical protein